MSSSPFSPDAARSLPGPPWLAERRAAAAERFAVTTLPTTAEEVWRYSRIDELDLDRYRPFSPNGAVAGVDVPAPLGVAQADFRCAARVVVVDGVVVHAELSPDAQAQGAYAGRLLEHPEAESLLSASETVDVFGDLNDAFAVDPVLVSLPAGVALDLPVVVEQWIRRADVAVFPRLLVRVGEGASLTLLDEHRSDDGVPALVVPHVDLVVERDARLGYCNVQLHGTATWQIGTQIASVDAGASLVASTAALGGDYARVRTDCRLVGAGASGDLVSLYFGNGDQMLDFRTFQEHVAPHTTSNLLFKGVVDDRSRSVYTGLIRVQKGARGTNAFQTNRNLKLSDDAWAESVPNLEIENNDVRCSHASTVGPIDDDQRFYLESRGVPPPAAERLVVEGFFAEVLERIPVPAALPQLHAAIAAKLDAHVEAVVATEGGVR
ncbi:MAG TPA: Fe-S cluster assembly protein SufD [Acidimicrobiales bacterium]